MAGGAATAAGGATLTLDGAQQWLDTNQPGITVEGLTTFPVYDTLHTERNGTITGMPSLNATTEAEH